MAMPISDAAAFAASAGVDLRFDHPNRAA